MKSDVIVGLQHGDEGKGKVSLCLSKDKKYTLCLRYNGGPNAGHTIYKNGKKIVLHQIPCGILEELPSIIGSGCVIDLEKLSIEIEELKTIGLDIDKLLKISFNAHIITKDHITDDMQNDTIGSTSSGIRPVNRDKYNRNGKRIMDIPKNELEKYIGNVEIINPVLYIEENDDYILCEGAQGFELDIDHGHYPFVTSTHCCSGFVFNSGIAPNKIKEVYGVSKIYSTYIGQMQFQPENDQDLNRVGLLGNEFGSTTSRKRQCNWLNLDRLKTSMFVNGVTILIINKCDIIIELGVYKLINNNEIIQFESWIEMTEYIIKALSNYINPDNIRFSYNKDFI